MYRKILVPLDGSAFGELALPMALEVAQQAGATLCLAHVCADEWSSLASTALFPSVSHNVVSTLSEQAYLDRLAQQSAANGDRPIEVALLDGPIAKVLDEYARAKDVDLIVMCTHGRGALGRVWLGSVASELVCRASAPVLLVRPPRSPRRATHLPHFRHILVPLDGSSLAERVLAPALELGQLTQAKYTLLQALDPLLVEHTQPPYAAGLERSRLSEIWDGAQEYLERVAACLRQTTPHVETSIVVDQPAQAINRYAAMHDVDVIAMATHGHSGVVRYILGSVADTVLHRADLPILLVRPPAE